jgi:hypothetical protein
MRGGAQIGAGTLGAGKGGSLTVKAGTIVLEGTSEDNVSTGGGGLKRLFLLE